MGASYRNYLWPCQSLTGTMQLQPGSQTTTWCNLIYPQGIGGPELWRPGSKPGCLTNLRYDSTAILLTRLNYGWWRKWLRLRRWSCYRYHKYLGWWKAVRMVSALVCTWRFLLQSSSVEVEIPAKYLQTGWFIVVRKRPSSRWCTGRWHDKIGCSV